MQVNDLSVRLAVHEDLDRIKRLFDSNRVELGFVLRPSLASAIEVKECLVATLHNDMVGCVHYHHRRDGQTTLYHIAVVSEYRESGIGHDLVEGLKARCVAVRSDRIFLKCPVGLPANDFYRQIGFELVGTEAGRLRALNHWMLKALA